MIDLKGFYGDYSQSEAFRAYIYTPFLSKTKLDIVYTDMVNWERHGLLEIDYGVDIDKTAYKSTSLCFMEYVWLRIVSHLREFGFSYEQIKSAGELMTQPITVELLKEQLASNLQYFESKYDSAKIERLRKRKGASSYVTLLEFLVKNTIINKEQIRLLFFKYPTALQIINKQSLDELSSRQDQELLKDFNTQIEKPHTSFSLSKLTHRYISLDSETYTNEQMVILNREEHKIITLIRQRYSKLLSVNVKFKNGKATYLELNSLQKAEAEKRLLEYIKKGEYSTMEFQVIKGEVLRFTKTEKHKL